jgi:hypothetical protein
MPGSSNKRRERLDNHFWARFKIKMEYTTEEASYMTQPLECVERDRYLERILRPTLTGLIIDAYACVGGDAIAFMDTFRTATVHAVQIGDNTETR